MGIYPSTHKTLLKKIQDGDEISWQEFYDRYSPVILNICIRMGLPPVESEDVTQNVMFKFFQNKLIFSYDGERARFRTYFNQIVRSCILDHLRKDQSRNHEIPMEPLPDRPVSANESEIFDDEWRQQCLQDALDQLKNHVEPQTFLAFHMQVFQQKKPGEVAAFLHINTSQAYQAKSRCIAKLKKIISEQCSNDPDFQFQWDCR